MNTPIRDDFPSACSEYFFQGRHVSRLKPKSSSSPDIHHRTFDESRTSTCRTFHPRPPLLRSVRSPTVREGNIRNWPSLTVGLLTLHLPQISSRHLSRLLDSQQPEHRRRHVFQGPFA